jgi:ADP-ribose pyrophosphatase YjhB (NUDIX family)
LNSEIRAGGGEELKNNNEKWLVWAKQIQAISQIGLTYSKDVFDTERYEQLRNLSVEILSEYTEIPETKIRDLFANEEGYATPKVDIRSVVMKDNQILLVKEKADGAWSLPGGWADIGLSPSEIAVKETKEESGFEVEPVRILAVLDKSKHDHPASPYHTYKIFILCKLTGGRASEGIETDGVDFFPWGNLPPLSLERNNKEQIELMFELYLDPSRGTIFD